MALQSPVRLFAGPIRIILFGQHTLAQTTARAMDIISTNLRRELMWLEELLEQVLMSQLLWKSILYTQMKIIQHSKLRHQICHS